MNDNGYCVKGILDLFLKRGITLEETEEIVNTWIEMTAKKFYSEGVLDGLRRNDKSMPSDEREGRF